MKLTDSDTFYTQYKGADYAQKMLFAGTIYMDFHFVHNLTRCTKHNNAHKLFGENITNYSKDVFIFQQ